MVSVIALGFPGAGVRMMCNTFLKKRYIETSLHNDDGKIKYKKIDSVLKSDDDIDFKITVMSGIKNFSNSSMVEKEIVNYNIIMWCSNINCAFLTDIEKKYVDRMLNVLHEDTIENCRSHELVICLTKCDVDITNCNNNIHNQNNVCQQNDNSDDEIVGGETTNCVDVYKKISNMYESCKIMLYNSYGCIMHESKKCSDNLKKLVNDMCVPYTYHNIDFNLGWYIDSQEARTEKMHMLCFEHNYKSYMRNVYKYKSDESYRNSYFYNIYCDWESVQKCYDMIKKILQEGSINVLHKIIKAFICVHDYMDVILYNHGYIGNVGRCDDIRKLIQNNYESKYECNCDFGFFSSHHYAMNLEKKMNSNYSSYESQKTLLLLRELGDTVRDAAKRVYLHYPSTFDNNTETKNEKKSRTYPVFKYWLLFQHSLVYYRKFYEYYDEIMNNYVAHTYETDRNCITQFGPYTLNTNIIGKHGNELLMPILKSGLSTNNKPSIHETYVPISYYYDMLIYENNKCILSKEFINECKKVYMLLWPDSSDVDIVAAIICAKYSNKKGCSSYGDISIFQKHTYKSFNLDKDIGELFGNNNHQ